MNAVKPVDSISHPVPGPKGHFIMGHIPDYQRGMLQFERTVAKEYGDVVHLNFAGRQSYLISNPDDIRKVLVEEPEKYIKAPIYRLLLARFLGNGLLITT